MAKSRVALFAGRKSAVRVSMSCERRILRIIIHFIFSFDEKGIPLKTADYLMHSVQVSVTKCDAKLSKRDATK